MVVIFIRIFVKVGASCGDTIFFNKIFKIFFQCGYALCFRTQIKVATQYLFT